MNLKLAKKIRQGMREMAQAGTGAIKGIWPEDYEGRIPLKGDGTQWAVETKKDDGSTELTAQRIMVVLKLTSARQVYKRAKRLVSSRGS